MKVLLADGSLTVIELMSHFIIKWGNEIKTASDGDELLKKLESGEVYDAVVTGNQMERMNGTVVLKYVRNSGRFKKLPFIVCSMDNSIQPFVEESGGIFVDKGSRRFIEDLHAALDNIAVKIAKKENG